MICSMLKTTYLKIPPKRITYRNYKKFSEDIFLKDLSLKFEKEAPKTYKDFQNILENILDLHAQEKEKLIRGHNKPHVLKTPS